MPDPINHIELAADVVSAYVGNNSVSLAELPAVIASVYKALVKLSTGEVVDRVVELKPAVPVKKSVAPDFIICLEDGKKFKSLKRHLRSAYDMSPADYRAKWGLAADYPMVAPNYATARSELAKKMGLGQQRAKAASADTALPAKRGRKAAVAA